MTRRADISRAQPRPPAPRRRLSARRRPRQAVLAALPLALLLPACSRTGPDYSARTPEQALDSARQMVVNGQAHRLVGLVHAENDQMRSLLNQIGELLGSLQALGEAVRDRFPEELAAFRETVRAEAEAGDGNPLLARLVAASRATPRNDSFGTSQIDREGLTLDGTAAAPGRTGPELFRTPRSDSQREIINDILKRLLADPYGWLADGREKLGTVYIADDTVALTWDDRPILPPFGLIMIERGGVWRLAPPTGIPVVRRIMPRTDDEWFVWGSMIKTLGNVVDDLERDVRAGRVRNLTDLADTAVEKAAIPAMLIFFAYSNLMDERQDTPPGPPPEP